MKRTRCISIISLLLICALITNLSAYSHSLKATNLMHTVKRSACTGKEPDSTFISSQEHFSAELFKACFKADKNKNILISPLSVALALAMTANGANGETKKELESVLAGGLPIESLNEYLLGYTASLGSEKKCRLEFANSIWVRDEDYLSVKHEFLQRNADYYNAEMYKADFDKQTLSDINGWVKKSTNGLIDKIIDEIDPGCVIYLINALAFEAEWQHSYKNYAVSEQVFTAYDGTTRTVDMMSSTENKYLETEKSRGFVKDYKNGYYSFAAFLPNEGVGLEECIDNIADEGICTILKNTQEAAVDVHIPTFSCDYDITMNDVLISLGIASAFDSSAADLSGIGKSAYGNLYIGRVLHKTHITVDQLGTKAAAVTAIGTANGCVMEERELDPVYLDRPFIYVIIDNSTKLPIFMGTVADICE